MEDGARSNKQRASDAAAACQLYGTLTGMDPNGDELESLIGDLLADLLHLAKRKRIDTERVIRMGQLHFEEEQ